jgi:hypothetical protein
MNKARIENNPTIKEDHNNHDLQLPTTTTDNW